MNIIHLIIAFLLGYGNGFEEKMLAIQVFAILCYFTGNTVNNLIFTAILYVSLFISQH